jgi:hypothetical protein
MTNHGRKKLLFGAASDFRDGLAAGEIMVGAMTAFAITVAACRRLAARWVAPGCRAARGVSRSSLE